MKRIESRLKVLEKTAPPNGGPPRELTADELAFLATHRELIDNCSSGNASIAEQCELVAVLSKQTSKSPSA